MDEGDVMPVRAGAVCTPTLPVFVKFTAPLPDASSVPPPVPIVNSRSVLVAAPTYFTIESWITRFPAAFDELPMLLGEPPLASVVTVRVVRVTVSLVGSSLALVAVPFARTLAFAWSWFEGKYFRKT